MEYQQASLMLGDPREPTVLAMLESIPTGSFAVVSDPSEGYRFYRIARPRFGNYKGWTLVQKYGGDVLHTRMRIRSDGVYANFGGSRLIDDLMLIIADWQRCAMGYARQRGKCAKCSKTLTDHRSRHYGIGPDCEKVWTTFTFRIDELHDGKTFETLLKEGTIDA